MRFPRRVIVKYYIYEATRSVGFFWPIFTLFLLYKGLTFAEIGVLSAISAVLTVVGETPTGYIGDRIGWRNSLIVSVLLLSASVIGFVFVETFVGFVVLYVIWSLGKSFRSGSRSAWLYETLEDEMGTERFAEVRGKGVSVYHLVSAATMIMGGILYTFDRTLPFLASGILNATGIFVLLSMPRISVESDQPSSLDALKKVSDQLSKPSIAYFVLYTAIFFGVVSGVDSYIQPITVDSVGLPSGTLGFVYAGFTATSAIGAFYAGELDTYLRNPVVVVPFVVLLFLGLPVLAFVYPSLVLTALPVFFLVKTSNSVMGPIVNQYLNDRIESVGRATVLSSVSMVNALVRAPIAVATGVVADLFTPVAALGFLSVIAFCAWIPYTYHSLDGISGRSEI